MKTATIDQSGKVTGQLTGKNYTSRIPTAVNDQTLWPRAGAPTRDGDRDHAVGRSIWSVIGALPPFILLLGLFFWISRRATRQLAGGIMGIGASKAKVYDEERPTTRFADVAGYEGAKREISEVVDFLKHPDRYAAAGAVGPARRAHGRPAREPARRCWPARSPVRPTSRSSR